MTEILCIDEPGQAARVRVPAVSLCVPASRKPAVVRGALESILAQTFEDFELIVTDDTGALEPLVRELDDARIVYRDNQGALGFVGNHMAALSLTRAPLVGFLHDDDELLPGYLAAAVEAFKGRPEVGVVGADFFVVERGVRTRRTTPLTGGEHSDCLPRLLCGDFAMLPSTTLFRREVLEQAPRPWPDLSCGDMVVYLHAAERGWQFSYLPVPLVLSRRHPGQISVTFRFRMDYAEFWRRCHFENPEAERLRRHRLSRALFSLARAHMKTGDPGAMKADLAEVLEIGGARVRVEALLMRALGSSRRLTALSLWIWRRFIPKPAAGSDPPRVRPL